MKQSQGDAPTIVQILPAMVRGGVERGTVEMADAIQKHGGRAIVVSRGGPMVRHLDRLGATHYQLDVHTKNPFRWPQVRSQLKAILSRENADLVHVRSRAPAWIALPVAAALGIAAVSTVHGRFIALSALKRIYNRKLLKTDHVIAISNYVKDLIVRQYVNIEDRLTVVHRGVDIDLFNPDNVNQTRIVNFVEGLAIPEDVPMIMIPARATAWKGHRILLQALAKIKERPFICLMIGAADGKPAFVSGLVGYGQKLGLEGRFRLTPLVDDMPAALMVADVVAMPSITPEPFGRVALEAQAMGRPVVAFDHGGATESIRHGETGWLAIPGDANSLAEALQAALDLNPCKRKTLATKARQHIEANFSTETMCRQTIKIYRRVLVRAAANRNAKS
ncbi:glycosyltransferase family 4 protein [Candidatus Puniceispirillum sp.]|nr:glycosyltransferase family 4 protein [Alphaproteobacteria bacterium]MDC1293663.1 glycosyltransferase family 4 protein [Candidatus Puniceispirillum sp.]